MAYIVLSQLQDRLGAALYARLTDRVNGAIGNDTVGNQIVSEAEAQANSYLSRRYATPVDLAAHPELSSMLASRVLDLAEALAWRGSPFVSDVPERPRFVQAEALAWFQDVAEGKVLLPVAVLLSSSMAVAHAPLSSSTPRSFTPDELDGL